MECGRCAFLTCVCMFVCVHVGLCVMPGCAGGNRWLAAATWSGLCCGCGLGDACVGIMRLALLALVDCTCGFVGARSVVAAVVMAMAAAICHMAVCEYGGGGHGDRGLGVERAVVRVGSVVQRGDAVWRSAGVV